MDPSAVLTLLIFAYLIKVASFQMFMWRPNCWKQTSVRSSIFQWACKSKESLVLKLRWLMYFCTVHNKSWKEIFSCMRTILLISNYWEEMKCVTNACIEWLHTKWDGYFYISDSTEMLAGDMAGDPWLFSLFSRSSFVAQLVPSSTNCLMTMWLCHLNPCRKEMNSISSWSIKQVPCQRLNVGWNPDHH